MLQILPDFPDDVLAVEWLGEVTADDYRNVLVPAALAKIAEHKHLRLLAILGVSFKGISAGAIWQDAKLGIGHWSDFTRVALVTDIAWIRDSMRLFAPLFPGIVRLFPNAERDAAKAWIVRNEAS
jgi:hypothetical protein